jgi:hypothetical protein
MTAVSPADPYRCPAIRAHPEPSWCGRYVMGRMARNGSPDLFDFLSALQGGDSRLSRRFPARLGVGFLLRCAAPGLLPVLPAAPRPSPPARRPWRRSLMTVTHDGSGGSGRDQRTGTSPVLGRRSFPLASTLNRALAVNRMACRRSVPDRNRGRPAFGPFRLPATETKIFRYAAFRSARACWSTTADTAPGQARSGVAVAAVRRAGRCAPPGPAPAHRTPQPPRLTGPCRRPRRRPGRPARWHLVRPRARRCRSGGPGSPRRCVPGRRVLPAGGAPGRGSGCGGRSFL